MKRLFVSLTIAFAIPVSIFAQSSGNTVSDTSKQNISVAFLQSFADAFNAHNVKAIMSFMTEDCLFEASAGEAMDGEKYAGQQEVAKAFEDVFATFKDAHWGNAHHFISGNRGFSEWVFTGTKSDGSKVEVTGCDLFTFRNGKIAIKNSYRKNRVLANK